MNLLGQSTGENCLEEGIVGGNYPGGNCPAIELEHEISFSLVNRSSSRFSLSRFSVLKFSLDLPFQNK